MRIRLLFKFICLVAIVLMFNVQGCTTTNFYSDSEVQDFEKSQKRQQGRARVDSASKIRTVPNRRPQSITNSKTNKGKG